MRSSTYYPYVAVVARDTMQYVQQVGCTVLSFICMLYSSSVRDGVSFDGYSIKMSAKMMYFLNLLMQDGCLSDGQLL